MQPGDYKGLNGEYITIDAHDSSSMFEVAPRNDVKQMWVEIDADEGVSEADFEKAMPEWSREMRFGS